MSAEVAVRAAAGFVDLAEYIGEKDSREGDSGLSPRKIPPPPVAELEVMGGLQPKERRTLSQCEAAREHAGTARWMIGMALESINLRRLYRGDDGETTWDEYLADAWDMTRQNAHWHIKEWRLRAAVSKTLDKTPPDSHVRELLDLAEEHGHVWAASAYGAFREYVEQRGQKVTADLVGYYSRNIGSRSMQPEPAALAACEEHAEQQAAAKTRAPNRKPVPPIEQQGPPSRAALSEVRPSASPAPQDSPVQAVGSPVEHQDLLDEVMAELAVEHGLTERKARAIAANMFRHHAETKATFRART